MCPPKGGTTNSPATGFQGVKSMNIHQFNLHFNPEEDRIIFRLNTFGREEFRFFFTRRFIKLLWPVLQQLLDNDLKRRAPETSHVSKAVLEFERETVVSQTNFQQKYVETPMTYPLGEASVLLSRIQVKQVPQGDILCLHPSSGSGIEFMVSNTFLHPFCKLLADTVNKADWNMNLISAPQMMQIQNPPGAKVLH